MLWVMCGSVRLGKSQPVRAWGCAKCGFTEFYALHPERILAAERQYRQQEKGPEVDSV
jgi:hypothetical protein